MNNIRKLVTAAFLLLLTVSLATAQRGRGNADPEQIAERQTSMMVEKLNLNDQQAAELKAVNLKYAEKFRELRGQRPGPEAMRELHGKKDAEIQSVLTEEQYRQWQETRPQGPPRQGKMRGKRGDAKMHPGRRADRASEGMTRYLDLNDEQTAQVKVINQQFAQQRQELQQKEMEPAERRAAMAELRTAQEAELKKVLTTEQYEKWVEERPGTGMGRQGKPGMGPEGRADRMIDHLDLDEAQAAQVKAIHEKYAEKRTSVREETDPAERRAAMEELRNKMDAELKGVLTPEQYEKWIEARPGPANGPKGEGFRGGQRGRR